MSYLSAIIGSRIFTMEQAEEAAKSLHKAMKGFGTDEGQLIKVIVGHKNGQRQLIKEKYMAFYGKKLEDDIKSEISGHFLDCVLALLIPTDEYDASCVSYAIKGIGTNEKSLIQIICPKESHEIAQLREAYERIYKRDIVKDVADDVGGHFGKLITSILLDSRTNVKAVDSNLASKEAQDFYKARDDKLRLEFDRILCSRSFPQLNATFDAYKQISNNDIEIAVKKETSGDLEKAFLAIVKSARNKPAYYAEELYNAMKGIGTNDNDLIRLLVSRSEQDLPQIKQEYKRLYGKSLYDVVKSETGGDYEKLLLALIGN